MGKGAIKIFYSPRNRAQVVPNRQTTDIVSRRPAHEKDGTTREPREKETEKDPSTLYMQSIELAPGLSPDWKFGSVELNSCTFL